jgi:hypothetical protein
MSEGATGARSIGKGGDCAEQHSANEMRGLDQFR